MHALTPASPIAIPSYSSTTIWKLTSTAFWPPARRRWLWTTDSPKHMLPRARALTRATTCGSNRGVRKGNRDRSELIRGYYFYARACVAEGKLERAATLFERAAEIKPDDYQSLCLLIQIYRSLGRDAKRRVQREKASNAQSPNSRFIRIIRGRPTWALRPSPYSVKRPCQGMVGESLGD